MLSIFMPKRPMSFATRTVPFFIFEGPLQKAVIMQRA
jgi:hypothetical protein